MRNVDAFLRTCRSPVDIDRAAGVDPLSVHDETILDAINAAPPTAPQRRGWADLSTAPYPTTPPSTVLECCGRGSGKSTRLVKQALFHLLVKGHWHHAMPGTRVFATVTAGTLKQSAEVVRVGVAVLTNWAPLGIAFEVRDEGGANPEIVITKPARPCAMVLAVAVEGDTGRGRAHCFLGRTEAGHSRSGPGYQATDATTHAAIIPRLAQFPGSQVYLESTPGRPGGLFFDWVTSPPKGAVLVRGSSFLINPNVPEETWRQRVPDPREYAQEVLATRFGMSNEAWLDVDAVAAALDTEGRWCA
jgi:hypothetical protein